ncbi:MAG: hypothetical protein KJS73_06250 [Gammaproteobacteria bacterium]|nr:hypothetical protein [Gammaproteobacteria bacterium]
MKKLIRIFATPFLLLTLLSASACSSNEEAQQEIEIGLESDEEKAARFDFSSEGEYHFLLGDNITVEGVTERSPTLFRKELGTAKGASITLREVFLWSLDKSDWERGGVLRLYNSDFQDNSPRMAYGITCELSPEDGDNFMKKGATRRLVDFKGKILHYSSSYGLTISPCEIIGDELDSM